MGLCDSPPLVSEVAVEGAGLLLHFLGGLEGDCVQLDKDRTRSRLGFGGGEGGPFLVQLADVGSVFDLTRGLGGSPVFLLILL